MLRTDASVSIVIPARYGSSRFPGKPLVMLAGKPMIQHVYERARAVPGIERVVVATDDERILSVVQGFNGAALLVEGPYRTGSDRVAAAAERLAGEIFVNLQGDEILLDPALLTDLIKPFLQSEAGMGTLKRRLASPADVQNPGVVKVVTGQRGEALYFSRAPIPHVRDAREGDLTKGLYAVHLGVYIFTRATLRRFTALPTGVLEEAEKLEQLRALEHGIPITVWETAHDSLRIDTPEDVPAAERALAASVRPAS
ncbi:3-deoxy-manno-octulosonate cytidylyltransferase [Candidatus Nitrospira bockiana]